MVGEVDGYGLPWSRNREGEIPRMAASFGEQRESRDSSRLHGGEVLQVSESGEGANEREERLPEGPSSYILSAGIGLWCTHDGLHWAS
jgi:hypothetical protein